ncbi:MAG TPA: hypothetical protein PLG91_08130 [Ferruginibacter sp.]|nr:hypothetical protein [Ferruginibacter sp.]
MDIKKWIIGGVTAGVLLFLLGWLVYGMLLMNFMNNHTGAAGNVMRTEPDMLYLVIGNLAAGFMLAFVFIKANITSAASGFVTAGILNFLMAVSVDCMIYATTTTISKTAMATDVAASTVMFAITGAITALVMNMGKKAA